MLMLLGFCASPSSSMLHSFTVRSSPPVTMQPGICGLMSRLVHAPVCAESVKSVGVTAGGETAEESMRASKDCTRPSSKEA